MKKVFVDTDIIFDLFLARGSFYLSAFTLFQLAEDRKTDLFVSSLCFTNLFYIMRKKLDYSQVINNLKKLSSVVTILSVDKRIIDFSLDSGFPDFEDSVQYFTARENGMEVILTRNIKDYKIKDIPIMTADEYLKLL